MRMLMHYRRVPVPMRMRLTYRIVRPMGMLVMIIVPMPMFVHYLGMPVLMLMTFGNM